MAANLHPYNSNPSELNIKEASQGATDAYTDEEGNIHFTSPGETVFAQEQQAEAIVNQMAQGVDVMNQAAPELSQPKQMGFAVPWVLGLLTGAISVGLLILGTAILR